MSVIDPEACLFLRENKCNICVSVCENKAIDLHQEREKIEVEVGAIILALGCETFDPKLRSEYGYGRMKNVITSLEFERMSSASGPYEGEILRPSDLKPPKRIAWVQCVGSRQVTPGANSYCSAVCCTYALKQVILAKEHDGQVEATIFHNDIRTFGKEFEQFYHRAESLPGVRIIRSYVSIGRELPPSKNVTIRYSSPDGTGVREEEFDLVVLSVGLAPPESAQELADKLSIRLNRHGFCETNIYNLIETSRPGIVVSGAFGGPKDIPESVVTASGASALCSRSLSNRRWKLAKERVFQSERNVLGEEPRVGVFICRCGTNIASVVDVPSLVQRASALSNVVHVEENLFSCSADTARQMVQTIEEKGLNRVVIAACTPRTHEPLFQDTLREAGINKYLVDMANIREHCSWVHRREKEKATEKAMDILRMSVARVTGLHPLKEFEVSVDKRGLVLGGGLAGMTSALSLAGQGFEVYLVEKDADLGGMARRIHYTLEGIDVQAYLRDIMGRVYQNPLIHVFTNSTVATTTGHVGNFTSKVISDSRIEEIRHGIAIIATGAEEYKPSEYAYGKDDRILTLLELEERIAKGDPMVTNAKSLVMILCVGSRQEDRPHCSRVCCSQSIKNALKLKERSPEMDIYIIYRDMRTYGFKEDYYRQAANRGVKFIRYDIDDKPKLEVAEDSLRISVADIVLGKTICINADVLALGVAVVPAVSTKEVSRLFKVSLSRDGFFLEAHAKLRPLDFAIDGVFLCGMAHFPKHIDESIAQALGAAGRAATILAKDKLVSSGVIAEVDEDKCIGCGMCQSICPFGAVEVQDTTEGLKARVVPMACKGCGICSARCPKEAIIVNHFTNSQIISQIDALSPTLWQALRKI